jgi:hypothetical protein
MSGNGNFHRCFGNINWWDCIGKNSLIIHIKRFKNSLTLGPEISPPKPGKSPEFPQKFMGVEVCNNNNNNNSCSQHLFLAYCFSFIHLFLN